LVEYYEEQLLGAPQGWGNRLGGVTVYGGLWGFGGFFVELIGRIRGVKSGKKGLFLQTKGGVEEQKLGKRLGGKTGRRGKGFTPFPPGSCIMDAVEKCYARQQY
jgi:hypothetical protein